jgi:hypothetical protein
MKVIDGKHEFNCLNQERKQYWQHNKNQYFDSMCETKQS